MSETYQTPGGKGMAGVSSDTLMLWTALNEDDSSNVYRMCSLSDIQQTNLIQNIILIIRTLRRCPHRRHMTAAVADNFVTSAAL
jgi:hypothetical protein